ncbi:MAG: 50S ribosomal protein L11 methyltransferase [Anaerolineae bacterium]|nr:50S ribosomal protein L11 methyltransferase [Anaerolineae bacterium]NUQ05874.1 50S ribosomal protein L11 methyltransferase [Anaerolineae bacterium]
MTRWIEITLRVDGEAAEAAAELLNRYGYQGVAVEHEGIPPDKLDEDQVPPATTLAVRAYLPDDAAAPEAQRQFAEALTYMRMMYPFPEPTFRIVEETDWAEAWKAHYHPIRLGRRILIRPIWVEVETHPDDVVIALDPGMAFGTGTHPTTQLCLEALEDHVKPGIKVFDLGTGSGILAIAAAKLGAHDVLAVDIDSVAVEVGAANVAQNGTTERIVVQQGSLETVLHSPRRFDLLLANILARVIIGMCDQPLGDVLRPGGVGIFSGILVEQSDEVETALRRVGLLPFNRRQQGDWVVIEARRPSE